jgi:hypothetical protein
MAARRAKARQSSTRRTALLVAILAILATACGADAPIGAIASNQTATSDESAPPSTGLAADQARSLSSVATATPSTTAAPSTTATPSTTAAPSTTATPSTTAAEAVAKAIPSATLPSIAEGPVFSFRVETFTDANAGRLRHSWRAGCPVGLGGLRLLTLSHWNFAGVEATGELVVAADAAEDILEVFAILFDARFPIERMELVDVYAGDDDLSMAANNTSAFNCREVAWKPGVWSNHAFGTAIDVNPLVNPYVSASLILPPGGAAFSDRSSPTLGGLYPGDAATAAFADIGWVWGGTWSSAKDWQHFSASGG